MLSNRIEDVLEILENEGWKYEKNENDVLLLVSFQNRKWKMVISCGDDGQVCCFEVYPWPVNKENIAKILQALNEINLSQRHGCFMINPTDLKVIFRCGLQIVDEYTSKDYIKNLLLSSVASFYEKWEAIYCKIFGIS